MSACFPLHKKERFPRSVTRYDDYGDGALDGLGQSLRYVLSLSLPPTALALSTSGVPVDSVPSLRSLRDAAVSACEEVTR